MKRFLMLTTTLLAFVSTANAQSLSGTALQNLRDGDGNTAHPGGNYTRHAPRYFAPTQISLPKDLESLEEAAEQLRQAGRTEVFPEFRLGSQLPKRAFEAADDGACCNEPTWYTQAIKHGSAAWQRVRAMMAQSRNDSGCCEAIAKPAVCKDGASCAVGAGSAKGVQVQVQTIPAQRLILRVDASGSIVRCAEAGTSSCPLTQLMKLACPIGFTTGKPAAPCCCAKACTCCETCKAKPTAAVQVCPLLPGMPAAGVPYQAFPQAPTESAWCAPPSVTRGSPLPPMPTFPSGGTSRAPMTWTAPMPAASVWTTQTPDLLIPPPPGARMVIGLPTSNGAKSVAHLVTPDMEVHCQTITHLGSTMILEGNVLLLWKKHLQPMRIEAQRVQINLSDGTFTVDSNPMAPVLRSSYPTTTWDIHYPSPAMQMPLPQRVIEVPMPR